VTKKLLGLSLVVLFGFATGICLGKYSGGDGSESTPYRISDANDINEIGTHPEDWSSHFVLVNDINLAEYTETEFNLIGTFAYGFSGVFDGNNNSISNFTYSGNPMACGFFGWVRGPGAEILNLNLIKSNISGGAFFTGALAGGVEFGRIYNCNVDDVNVNGNLMTGGLTGLCNNTTISNCHTTGNVTGEDDTGGLVGFNLETGVITNCYTTGTVDGNSTAGGLVGRNDGAVSDSYSTGNVYGDNDVGGLVGENKGEISNCYAVGDINGISDVGGLVGDHSSGYYTKCFWDRDINPDVNGIGNLTDPNIIGKSTAEMQTESTFTNAGWDFVEIWDIGENQTYPFLRVYPAGDLNHDGRVDGRDLAIIASRWLDGI